MRQALRANLQNVIAPVVVVGAWQLVVGGLEIPTRYLPSPSVILMTLWHQPVAFGMAMGTTLLEAVIGIVLGTLIGIVSGVIFFRVRLLERMFFPYFVASQAVPIIAFGALVIMWFGNGLAAKAFVALYLTFFPVAVNTLRGLRSVDPRQVDLLRTFGASSTTIFLKLQFPGALPSIFTAVRLGASLGLVGAIVGEWFGAQSGLGAILLLSMFNYQVADLWAAIVLTGIAGTLLFGVVVLLERQLAWWTDEL